jgi:hypothetical protein
MKLIVCGDSFASADINRPGTHFSELLGASINLARGGASNILIGFQLQTAISLNPDIVIFTSTDSGRIDYPIPGRNFSSKKGLQNFVYPYNSDSSTGNAYVGDLSAAIWSDVGPAFTHPRPDLPTSLHNQVNVEAVKSYIAYIQNNSLNHVTNDWLIGYWKHELTAANIPFVHICRGSKYAQAMYRYTNTYPELITQCVYHTDSETQVRVAEELNIAIKGLVI